MRSMLTLCVLGSLSFASAPLSAQDHHSSLEQRGASVMGFDQERTVHHFVLFTDGGAIDVSVADPRDTKNRDAIRSHLPHIAMMFGDGNFDAPMLVHDTRNIPGLALLTAKKNVVRYTYVETSNGGRVNIVTTDREAVAAVHAFLEFQITDHKTGDPIDIKTR